VKSLGWLLLLQMLPLLTLMQYSLRMAPRMAPTDHIEIQYQFLEVAQLLKSYDPLQSELKARKLLWLSSPNLSFAELLAQKKTILTI
jgi:hypothetical protein